MLTAEPAGISTTLKLCHCAAGLLTNMAEGGDALATLISKYNLLHWELDKTKNRAAADLQVRGPAQRGLAWKILTGGEQPCAPRRTLRHRVCWAAV